LLNGPQAPTIKEVNKVFMQEGVKLAVQAAEKALADWGGKREDITHLGEWERVCESGVCGSCLVWVSVGLDEREREESSRRESRRVRKGSDEERRRGEDTLDEMIEASQ
jgi:ferredoxin